MRSFVVSPAHFYPATASLSRSAWPMSLLARKRAALLATASVKSTLISCFMTNAPPGLSLPLNSTTARTNDPNAKGEMCFWTRLWPSLAWPFSAFGLLPGTIQLIFKPGLARQFQQPKAIGGREFVSDEMCRTALADGETIGGSTRRQEVGPVAERRQPFCGSSCGSRGSGVLHFLYPPWPGRGRGGGPAESGHPWPLVIRPSNEDRHPAGARCLRTSGFSEASGGSSVPS